MDMSETSLMPSGCEHDDGRRRGFLLGALFLQKKKNQRKQRPCGGGERGKRETLGRGDEAAGFIRKGAGAVACHRGHVPLLAGFTVRESWRVEE